MMAGNPRANLINMPEWRARRYIWAEMSKNHPIKMHLQLFYSAHGPTLERILSAFRRPIVFTRTFCLRLISIFPIVISVVYYIATEWCFLVVCNQRVFFTSEVCASFVCNVLIRSVFFHSLH